MSQPFSNTIQHFSHKHPLTLLSPDPQNRSTYSTCNACELKLSNLPSYTCYTCGFNLHKKCAELPQNLNHPFDQTHLLSLNHSKIRFTCNACKKHGYGFAYHCRECEIYLHTICANMPSRVTHQFHRQHQLLLTFSLSQTRNSFTCCICREIGSNSWLYSCQECQFHAHLLCARRRVSNPIIVPQPIPHPVRPQVIPGQVRPPVIPGPVRPPVIPGPVRPPTRYNSLIRRILSEMIENAASNIAQNPSQISQLYELLGGGGGSGFYPGDGSGLGSGYAGFDPSVYAAFDPSVYAGFDPSVFAVDPSVFTGFDPTLLGSLFSGLGFFGFM